MAMRITTKMMQNTSLRNLNTNKAHEEDLVNQMATGKKIARPSDDPVIAIRSLRLNSTLDKIEQYYNKNAEDAESWLDLTSSAISTVNGILSTNIKQGIEQVISSYEEYTDRQKIIDNLKNYVSEIYSTGNADSAGRSLFTGYRTDLPLTFKEDHTERNRITEQLTNSSIDTYTFVSTGGLKNVNEGNFNSVTETAYQVTTNDVYRIRLAYADIDIKEDTQPNGTSTSSTYSADVNVGYMSDAKVMTSGDYEGQVQLSMGSYTAYVKIDASGYTDKAVITVYKTGDPTKQTVTYNGSEKLPIGETGTIALSGITVEFTEDGKVVLTDTNTEPNETVSIGYTKTTGADGKQQVEYDEKYLTSLKVDNFYPSSSDDDAYWSVIGSENKNQITYIADRGEILLGSAVQKRLSELPSDTELRVTYDKSEWKNGDLDPVHYFYTEKDAGGTSSRIIKYNESFLDDPSASGKQIIEYDVGNNQTLRVNTTPDEFLTHDMGRDVEEVCEMIEEYGVLAENYERIEDMINSEQYSGDDLTRLQQQLEALGKAKTYVGDKLTARCDKLLDDCDEYISRTTVAETNCGARGQRLELIQNRLNTQKTSFEELVSENEDADYSELTVALKSVQLTYEAALSSISYVMQTTLLDFIR